MHEPLTLSDVFDRAGGRVAVAKLLGLDASTPYSWKQVPAQHVFRLAAALGVEARDLRPDIFAAPAPETPPADAAA